MNNPIKNKTLENRCCLKDEHLNVSRDKRKNWRKEKDNQKKAGISTII